MPSRQHKGFTLIEVILAVLAIAILAGVGSYLSQKSANKEALTNKAADPSPSSSPTAISTATPTASPRVSIIATPKPTSPAGAQAVTFQQIDNLAYTNLSGTKIQLVDGTGTYPTQISSGSLSVVANTSALGDLNGDGVSDAAVMLKENDGGTGWFYWVAAVVAGKETPTVAAYTSEGDLGDRPRIQSITLVDGVITVQALTQGPTDSSINPTVQKTFSYKLVGSKLVKQ